MELQEQKEWKKEAENKLEERQKITDVCHHSLHCLTTV